MTLPAALDQLLPAQAVAELETLIEHSKNETPTLAQLTDLMVRYAKDLLIHNTTPADVAAAIHLTLVPRNTEISHGP